MNAKQKRFCDEYLIDCNATQAAIRAGYSEKTAYSIAEENLRKPELRAYIDEQFAQIQAKNTASAQEVMEYLTSVMRGTQKEQVLRMTEGGVQSVIEMGIATKDRLKAAELLGKRFGMFKESLNIEGALPVVIDGGDALAD